jgi:hypothetical protein
MVTVPYGYLFLPLWLTTAVLGCAAFSTLFLMIEPVWRGPWMTWAVVVSLISADLILGVTKGPGISRPLLLVNNTVLMLVLLGAANIWAQNGMRARHLTMLAVGLAVYDVVATTRLALMQHLVARLSMRPFAPIMGWHAHGHAPGIGFGDLLLATVFPLVIRRAYGRRAGHLALASMTCAIVVILTLVDINVLDDVPAMAALGPLMVAQYAFWNNYRGDERRTWKYLADEVLPRTPAGS